jgi:hypothetical protein
VLSLQINQQTPTSNKVMSKKKILLIAFPAILLIILYLFFRKGETDSNQVIVSVKRGTFNALVFSSGQLESEKSESINIP